MPISDKIINALAKRRWKELLNHPPSCPFCKQGIALPMAFPDEGIDLQVKCHQCGETSRLGDLLEDDANPRNEWKLTAADLVAPAATKIHYQKRDDGTEMWLLPKTGKSSIGSFAYIWCGFIVIFSMIWIPATLFGENENPWQRLAVFAPVPFLAVGWWLMRTHIREAKSDYLIELDQDTISLTRRTRGKKAAPQVIARNELKEVGLVVFYSVNYQPIHGIEIRSESRKIRFGASLEVAEKRWLTASLRQRLELEKFRVEGISGAPVREAPPSLAERGSYQSKKLELKALSDDSFRVRCAASGAVLLGLIGLAFLGMGVLVLVGGFGASGGESSEWDWIGLLQGGISSLVALVFSMLGLALLYLCYRQWGRRYEWEFSDGGVNLQEIHSSGVNRHTYRMEQVGRMQHRSAGHVNNQPRYEVSIQLDGRKRRIVRFAKARDADALAEWITIWRKRREEG